MSWYVKQTSHILCEDGQSQTGRRIFFARVASVAKLSLYRMKRPGRAWRLGVLGSVNSCTEEGSIPFTSTKQYAAACADPFVRTCRGSVFGALAQLGAGGVSLMMVRIHRAPLSLRSAG